MSLYTSNISLIHPPSLYQGEAPAATLAMHAAVTGEGNQEEAASAHRAPRTKQLS